MNKIILKIKGIKNKIVENVSNHILENHILNANYKGFIKPNLLLLIPLIYTHLLNFKNFHYVHRYRLFLF